MLRDLGSTNGSFVQGSRFKELTLGFGTEVTIGRTVLKYLPDEEEVELAPSEEESFGSLVGRDPKMRRLFRVLDDVAATDATVLIEGETGTGKELLAEEIHRHSPRKDGPFVVFDCGAVPDELIESALFGHVRGAFTGAITDRPGAFEEADGGTLFLDEIGELAPDVQPALLRALDKQAVRPVGGSTYTRASVRVVAATNRDLRAEVAAAASARTSTTASRSCAWRCRRCASAPTTSRCWSQHFMRQFRRRPPAARSRARTCERLRRHDWPGNVRELRNVIERACAVSHGDRLELDDALDDAARRGRRRGPRPRVDVDLPFKEAKAQLVEVFEREYIQALLEAPQGEPVGRGARRARSIASTCASCSASTGCASRATLDMGAAGWLARAARARRRAWAAEISGGVSGASPTPGTRRSTCASCCGGTAPSACSARYAAAADAESERAGDAPGSRPC